MSPMTTSNPPVTPHKHSSSAGDGGVLDADTTEVDSDILETWDIANVLIYG